ncbi:MAG: CotH kinase family protein [Bacteroidales bacterium]|nr:CotH kinase family protein [Bacteroidales bacterium]
MNFRCLIISVMSILVMGLFPLRAQVSVDFSHSGGCYEKPFALSLSVSDNADNPNCVIRFTLNGSLPTANSPRYVKPIALSGKAYSRSEIFRIQNAPDKYWYQPDNVEHIIVVRAAVFDKDGNRVSEVETNSYVIESLLGRKIRMSIVSLCVDSMDLFDFQNGIFIPGVDFNPDNPSQTGNYYRRGRSAERQAHFEYINNEEVVAQACGLRTHGNIGRRYAQKGLSLYARNEYGKKNFKDVLPSGKDKRLVLRPFGNAWTSAGIQDYFCQQIAAGLNFDALECKPVALFLNGEYWGIYYLEQKPDEKFIAKRHGFDPDSVRLVRDWAGHNDHGIDSGFVAMMRWLKTADLADPKQYAQISGWVDIPSFIDYVLFETFIGNRDWPANNMRCWSAEGSPWRFIFFDGDGVRTTKFNAVQNALYDGADLTWPTSSEATLLLRKLLENKDFKEKLRARLKELRREKFRWSAFSNIDVEMSSVFGVCVNDVEAEIASQSARFGYPKSVKAWKRDVRRLRRYFKRRARRVNREWRRVL